MISDDLLYISRADNLANPLLGSLFGALPPQLPNFYPLHFGLGANRSIDLKTTNIDKGNGYPLKARFDIKTSFASADAGMTIRFGAVLGASPDYLGVDQVGLAFTRTYTLAELAVTLAGFTTLPNFVELTIPKIPTIAADGRQFLFLGMDMIYNTGTIGFGAQLLTAGAVEARVLLDTQSSGALSYPSGFSFSS